MGMSYLCTNYMMNLGAQEALKIQETPCLADPPNETLREFLWVFMTISNPIGQDI